MQAVVIYLVSFIMLSILEFNTGSEIDREHIWVVDAEIFAVHVFDMIERKNIVRTGEDAALFQLDFRYPVFRQVVIYIQVTQFQVFTIYQPLCTVLEVIGIVQR